MVAVQVMHEVVARSRGSHGFSLTSYYLTRWLWGYLGWWTLPLVLGVAFAWGMLKRILGIGDDG